jgi:hypothetical protein
MIIITKLMYIVQICQVLSIIPISDGLQALEGFIRALCTDKVWIQIWLVELFMFIPCSPLSWCCSEEKI